MRLLTLGHGTISAAEFTNLIRGANAGRVVDIRSVPGSRHNPQFGRVEMERWLPAAGIQYCWAQALGGFRKPSIQSPNTALRHPAFRGYADHMLTGEFSSAVDVLLHSSSSIATVVMCSESVWWRCHRRLLSDYLTLVRNTEVRHLLHDATLREHRLTDGVRAAGGAVVYDRLPVAPDG
jgi:uncharacterized protein (DUF488 family)